MAQTVPGFDRLTVEPDKLGGQPCIRGYRFGVEQLLEPEDAQQVFAYAAALAQRDFYLPLQESA
jgi:uncharacterized protein (DUF433 family)